MHPREGWPGPGGRIPGLSRRGFIRRAGTAGLLLGGLEPLLAACGAGATAGAKGRAAIPLPRPDHPVTWPIFPGNHGIPKGLRPERNATLRIFNWTDYVNPQCLKDFSAKFGCKIEVTTFSTMTEAMTKLRSGQVDCDVFMGATVDVLGPLIEGKYIQPLNHSYLGNLVQAWPDMQDPFYDGNSQYTVPYTIYTTGIAWRKDRVPEDPYKMANPWAMLWQTKYYNKIAILDDYREAISLGLMKNGIYDLNTTSEDQILRAKQSLVDLSLTVNVHIDSNDYLNVPSGQMWIHHAWSGDIAAAPYYLPKGVSPEVIGYWFPADGKGPVGNDTLTVLAGAQNPVLAHAFLNYLLDVPNALTNISFNGYMQPLTAITPQRLVKEGLLAPNLTSTAVLPSYFRKGLMELQLPPAADALWEQAWIGVSRGILGRWQPPRPQLARLPRPRRGSGAGRAQPAHRRSARSGCARSPRSPAPRGQAVGTAGHPSARCAYTLRAAPPCPRQVRVSTTLPVALRSRSEVTAAGVSAQSRGSPICGTSRPRAIRRASTARSSPKVSSPVR